VQSPSPKGTFAKRVEDILSNSEIDSALQKAHRASTWLCILSWSWASVLGWYNEMWKFDFKVHDMKTHVCKLKQDPRSWCGRIDSFLKSLGFTKSKDDSNLYFKVMNDEPIILLLYIDDLFLNGEENIITYCNKKLVAKFEMKDLGLMHYLLGI